MNQPANWLKDAVVYEIYPQSFLDTNGDGIGDFQGIIDKLDYVKSLGANAIWMNPCFDSPFQDAGYDVRDFCKTAARYGSMDDIKRLFAEAHKRGIKVLLDLVAGHVSIEHEWFKQALSGKDTPYNNFFCFSDGWSGCQGNYDKNFISGYGNKDGYYMINFFYSQPALNYGFIEPDPRCNWQLPIDHPEVKKVRRAIRDVMQFWLNAGCDGFRVDMASSLVRCGDPKNTAAKLKGITDLWQEYKSWMKENYPDAVLVAEWGNPTEAITAGFDMDFFLSWGKPDPGYHSLVRKEAYLNGCSELKKGSARSFFCANSSGNSRTFTDEFLNELSATKGKGYACMVTGNHDSARIRRGRTEEDLKVMYTCIFTLPGVPYLYYGDEIGMRYVDGVGNVEGSYERGGARTPMQWTTDPKTAGFSSAEPSKFYIKLDEDKNRPNVESQEKDPDSLLNFTRAVIDLRHKHPALSTDGEFRPIVSEKSNAPFIYERHLGSERFIVALNPSASKTYASELGFSGKLNCVLSHGAVNVEVKPGTTTIKLGTVSAAIFKID